MGRRRKMGQSIKELLLKYQVDPIEEMLKMTQCQIPMPKDPKVLVPLLDRYDVIVNAKGDKVLTLKTERKFDIYKELAQYIYPKLRASENKNTTNSKISINIKRINVNGEEATKTIDVTPVKAALKEVNGD